MALTGLQVLQLVKEKCPEIPVIIVTGTGSEEIAVQAIKMGASDYVIKSVKHIKGLVPTIKTVLKNKKIQDEHKITLTALRESEERFRLFFNNSMDAVFLTVPDGTILQANAAACTIFGRTEEEIKKVGRNGIIDTTDPRLAIALEERLRTGKYKGELTGLRKNGTPFPIEISSALFQDSGGNPRTSMIIRDISERKLAEEKLELKNAILSTQQEVSIDGILVVNEQGEIISFNNQFMNMWHIPIDVLELKSDKQTLHFVMDSLENPKEFMNRVKYLYEHHHETSREEIVLKDGRTFDRYSSPMFGNDAKYYGRVWYFRDISDRKHAEEIILKERTLLRILIDNLPVGVFVKDKDYRKILVNPIHSKQIMNHMKYLGLNSEIDILGKTDFEVFPKELAAEFFAEDQQIVKEGSIILNREGLAFSEEGNQLWLLVSKIPLRDNNGEIIGMVGVTNDITERKRIEEALASEQYLMYVLMRNVPDRIYFKDRDSKFIRISKAQAQLFGLSDPAQAIDKSDFDFFSEEHARQAYNDEQEIIRTGQSISKEEKETWPDRPDTWVYSSKLPLRDKEGNIIGTFGISVDITVRKEMEFMLMQKNQEIESQNEEYLALNDELEQTNKELMLAKEKAEESDKLKTAFLQNMSHEIRTPMNGILGFAELLKNPKLPETKQQEFIRIIEKSGQRMLNIISDIVNISKIETGQIELNLQETNVNGLLQHLHTFFSPEAERKGLSLTFKPGLSDELCKIETDDLKLTQVLSNLINNALKFTKSGTIDFGYQQKGQVLEFYVQDTGIGIAPENQDIIFERFRQVDMADARKYEGAGLGLSISKAFVEKLGGTIWVKSELDKGSTFFFNIPYNPKVIIKSEKLLEARLEAKLSGINILIAEDDDVCMELLKEMLEDEKARLFFAHDGQEALDIINTTPKIQVVLMDLKMPVLNGFEATKLIKRLKPKLPIIAQSAYSFSNDQDKAKIAGCDDFIGKPVKRELLLSKINNQLSKK